MPHNPRLRRPWFDVSFIIITIIGIGIIIPLYLYYPWLVLYFLIPGIVLYLGFGIPRWQGSRIRKDRARIAMQNEKNNWGFHSRDREGPWLNYIDYPLVRETGYANGKRFFSDWLIIEDGFIIVNPGPATPPGGGNTVDYDFSVKRAYAWDGCTPKRWFFWLALVGTPDWGQRIEKVKTIVKKDNPHRYVVQEKAKPLPFWQRAHHASLVHDVLYQYLDSIPIAKKDVDHLFYEMLRESDVSWFIARLYHFGVKYFGAWGISRPQNNSTLNFLNSQNLVL